jgi:hypothetical protein
VVEDEEQMATIRTRLRDERQARVDTRPPRIKPEAGKMQFFAALGRAGGKARLQN